MTPAGPRAERREKSARRYVGAMKDDALKPHGRMVAVESRLLKSALQRSPVYGRGVRILTLFLCLLCAVACRNILVGDPAPPEGEGEGGCPTIDRPAVSVRVDDASNLILICDATVRLQDDTFSTTAEVVTVAGECRYEGGIGRPGAYVLSIEKPGYVGFTNPNALVDTDSCGDPVTRGFEVSLQRE